jgi:hypothetical protein
VRISAYQPTIQQCFSFITNQHQPESASQKPSGEQGVSHVLFDTKTNR